MFAPTDFWGEGGGVSFVMVRSPLLRTRWQRLHDYIPDRDRRVPDDNPERHPRRPVAQMSACAGPLLFELFPFELRRAREIRRCPNKYPLRLIRAFTAKDLYAI